MPGWRDLGIAVHDAAAIHLTLPALRVVAARKAATRHDARYYDEGRAFRRASHDWPTERRLDWILAALRAAVRRAARAPYYRAMFDRVGFDAARDFTFDDFATLPVLERADVQAHRDALVPADAVRDELTLNATGGSSGVPVELFMGPQERGWRASGADHAMWTIGVEPGRRRAYLWGHHLDPVAVDTLKARVLNSALNQRWFECLRLSPETLRGYHDALQRYRPRCLVAYASALHALAAAIDEQRLEAPRYPTRRFVTGAEKLFAEQRALIARVFDVPLHERYGSRDVGDVGFQYAPGQSLDYTIDWALVMVEPASTERESDIIVTKLQADGMPMLRYRTDDVGVFPDRSRPGAPCFVLHEVLGRRTDRIMRPQGGWVSGLHFPHLLKDVGVNDFRVEQAADYSVTVSVVLKDPAQRDALDRIEANLAGNLPDVPVTVVAVDDIPKTRANKWRPVVTHVTPGGRS